MGTGLSTELLTVQTTSQQMYLMWEGTMMVIMPGYLMLLAPLLFTVKQTT